MNINHTTDSSIIKRQDVLGEIKGVAFTYKVTDVYRLREMALWSRVNAKIRIPGKINEEDVEFTQGLAEVRFIYIEKFRNEDRSKVGEREVLVGTREQDAKKAFTVLKRYITTNDDISLARVETMFENNMKQEFDKNEGKMVFVPDPIPDLNRFDSLKKINICKYAKVRFDLSRTVALNMSKLIVDFNRTKKSDLQ